MDPTGIASKIITAASLFKNDADAIRITDKFVEDVKSWGAAVGEEIFGIITVLDVTRDGGIVHRGSDLAVRESIFRSQLPQLEANQTRIFLKDLQSSRSMSQASRSRSRGRVVARLFSETNLQTQERNSRTVDAVHPGKLVYDDGEPMAVPTFESLWARPFDIWNLQSLWRPRVDSEGCHFYLQTDVLENLMDRPSALDEQADLSRLVLFFGRYTIALWLCLSSVRSEFMNDGGIESKL